MYIKKEDPDYFEVPFYVLNKAMLKEILKSRLKPKNPKHKQGRDR